MANEDKSAKDLIILTPEGKADLEKELDNLINVERPKNKEELALARSQGDLSENADYDAARARQAEIEGRINQINYILEHCTIREIDKNDKSVQIGSFVTVERQDNNKQIQFKVVGGSQEADFVKNYIDRETPLGKAVFGKLEGDIVEVRAPKPYKVKIVSVKFN